MAATDTYKCQQCKQPFTARTADRKRGWARFCSKSCKAVKQEKRTGQYVAHQRREQSREYTDGGAFFDRKGEYVGFSGHNFSNEE